MLAGIRGLGLGRLAAPSRDVRSHRVFAAAAGSKEAYVSKKEVIDAVAAATAISHDDAAKAVDALLDTIVGAVASGGWGAQGVRGRARRRRRRRPGVTGASPRGLLQAGRVPLLCWQANDPTRCCLPLQAKR